MDCELRCFYPLPLSLTSTEAISFSCFLADNDQQPLEKQLLSLAFSTNSLFDSPLAEQRMDEYINLHTAEFGLKFRGGKHQLELKTRKAVIPSKGGVGVEEWSKSVVHIKDKSLEAVHKAIGKSSTKAAKLLPAVESDYKVGLYLLTHSHHIVSLCFMRRRASSR